MFQRWESQSRYYLIHVQEDLFGTTTLRRVWGDLSSARGGQKLECLHPGEVAKRLAFLAVQRGRRGYHRIQ